MNFTFDDTFKKYQTDPLGFQVDVLGRHAEYMWSGMAEVANSVVYNTHTAVRAGHGVSKTYGSSGLVPWFLYCFPRSSIITTAPTGTQVEQLLWREIREAHETAKVDLPGDVTNLKIDLQPVTGVKWFALGFATKPDTVTKEATAFQGYHNDNMLIILDEAAGILPEIWRAIEHIGGNYITRVLVVGNATSDSGDFVDCFSDPDYNKIQLRVTDTPNYIEGRNIVPGVYGREYERRIISKYGKDSDEYNVRVLGEISKKGHLGSYYSDIIQWLGANDRIGDVPYNPSYPVFTTMDPGFTTAMWAYQLSNTGMVHFLRYYEDSNRDAADYAAVLMDWKEKYGYRYAKHTAPIDVDNNQYRLVAAEGLQAIFHKAGVFITKLPMERSVRLGIERTKRMLRNSRFSKEGCKQGITKLKAYHEAMNKRMSTEDNPVFTGVPEKDGNDHAADAMRYVSLSIDGGYAKTSDQAHGSRSSWKAKKRQYA